ncbi:hypothetical protein MTO96_036190 [Rhipicephalus appendiculatus]
MATLAAAGATMSTGPNATMSTPKHSCPEATSLHEPLNGCATLSDFDREQMECHENNEGGDISLHDTDMPASRVEREEDKEGDWQTVLTIRQKKALARAGRKAMAAASGYDSSSQHQGPTKPPPMKKKSRVARLPPLPKDDFKIILRPHQGLPIKDLTAPQVSEAVIMATQRKVRGEHFLLRLKPGSNIIVVSTPNQEVADIVRKITTLVINGKQHAVNAYVTAGEDTKKGVVHGLAPHTSPETLLANLRIRTQGVEILRARMLGETKTAVITFYGPIVPRFVYYMGGEMPCYRFKHTVQFCNACIQTGHRTDVCPQPHSSVCNRCGAKEPEAEHECKPTCTTCGEEHLAGSKDCKKRYKPSQQNKKTTMKSPGLPKAPIKESPPRPRWYDTEDTDDDAWPPLRQQEDLQAASPPRQPLRSRQRRSQDKDSDSSNHLPSKLQSTPTGSTQRSATPTRKKDSFNNKVSWAGEVHTTAPITSNPEYQKIVTENKQLKQSLGELKLEIAALKSQLAATAVQAKPTHATPPVRTEDAPSTEKTLQVLVQQIQSIQNFQQQLYADLQGLKGYVEETLARQRPLRKRANSNLSAPSASKAKNGVISDSTEVESVINNGS